MFRTHNFHGNWRLWTGPCSSFSSWISRRLPRTSGRAPQPASLHWAFFFVNLPPPPQNYPELFRTVPEQLQNYLERFWGYFPIPAHFAGLKEEMQDCSAEVAQAQSGAGHFRRWPVHSTSHMLVRLPTRHWVWKAFSILAHFDPTSCSPLVTSNRFWNVLCMIYESYILPIIFQRIWKMIWAQSNACVYLSFYLTTSFKTYSSINNS